MAKIAYKEYPIETVAPDGTVLKGKIHYWSKDYYVHLIEPISVKTSSTHLMYMIPAKFIVDETKADGITIEEKGISHINIYHIAIKTMQEIYTDYSSDTLEMK
ncbi:hypothetical protein [Sulfurovum sp. NBC37-1]|uniref:hypothetical protein n=1 Tax=Sulfurovum sp. (strain NBC37-1) TaxID=387093 RepID=UPI000158798A|nr:hypothetical protein [Sulfurovum sp. NBC37-1]BAF73249.1 hypothetical protein SUN_2310 [Sulfurovum sp. NBC37-1]